MRWMQVRTLFAVMTLALVPGCGDDSSNGSNGGSAGNGGSSGNGGGGGSEIDACAIVTQADANDLFGETAQQGDSSKLPGLLGECLWEADGQMHGHLLQFAVWDGEEYYSEPADGQPLAVGEKGYIKVLDDSVHMAWVQDDKGIVMSYSTYGTSITPAGDKEAEMRELANKASAALP